MTPQELRDNDPHHDEYPSRQGFPVMVFIAIVLICLILIVICKI